MKKCSKCNIEKEESEFSKHKKGINGLRATCKKCCSEEYHKWHLINYKNYCSKNHEHIREITRNREKLNRHITRAAYKRHYDLHTDKCLARRAVNERIKDGRLIRPSRCSQCGIECIPQAYHPDYSKRLEIIWLCKKCHLKIHGKDLCFNMMTAN